MAKHQNGLKSRIGFENSSKNSNRTFFALGLVADPVIQILEGCNSSLPRSFIGGTIIREGLTLGAA